MDRLNKYGVLVKSWSGALHRDMEMFILEKEARNYANDQWKTGAMQVSLYIWNRGWKVLKTVSRPAEEASKLHENHIQRLAALAGATLERNVSHETL